ncbi:unnamed protein product [Owenia fusiformis]|uniref:Uncharacterized protein n=1 Tax=Owenia fusiformis TaxID=6347 RepID=A0A8J1T5E1_OWEFU|nr:unnamed protein product [Owenia fusiformis]
MRGFGCYIVLILLGINAIVGQHTIIFDYPKVDNDSILIARIKENAPAGSRVIAFHARYEVYMDGLPQISYVIIGEDSLSFTTNGSRVVTLENPLRKQLGESYSIVLIALYETESSTSHARLDIKVIVSKENLQTPYFPSESFDADVSRHANVGTNVTTIHADDDDEEEYNARVKYHLTSADEGIDLFNIDETTGVVTTRQELLTARNSYTLTVTASDFGSPIRSKTADLTIHVKNISEVQQITTDALNRTTMRVCWREPLFGNAYGYEIIYFLKSRPNAKKKILLYVTPDGNQRPPRKPSLIVKNDLVFMCFNLDDLISWETYSLELKAFNSQERGVASKLDFQMEVDVCIQKPCVNGRCEMLHESPGYRCICTGGYTGVSCNVFNPCSLNPCNGQGTCKVLSNFHFECNCYDGYYGSDCAFENHCVLQRPCRNGGTCTNDSTLSYRCLCPQGYYGENCQFPDPCVSGYCLNGATCVNITLTSVVCECPDGYSSERCDIFDWCSLRPCEHGGVCENINKNTTAIKPDELAENNYRCRCPSGFSGPHCQYYVPCDTNICENGGQCIVAHKTKQCLCPDGFYGIRCQYEQYFPCANHWCYHGGIANSIDGQCICDCELGRYGPHCEHMNLCKALSPCHSERTVGCLNTSNSDYYCRCMPEWAGENCTEINSCHPDPCKNDAKCVIDYSNIAKYSCVCPQFYHGPNCEYFEDSPCIGHSCLNGATCKDIDGTTYECLCPEDYYGEMCARYDKCNTKPCLNGGLCVTKEEGEYECECIHGASGKNCEHYNPCFSQPCVHDGMCRNVSATEYMCDCPPTYCGKHCENITTCSTNHCIHGKCIVEGDICDGVFSCECTAGYTGRLCGEEIDPCYSNPCNHNSSCQRRGRGSFDCTCSSGFTGTLCQTKRNCTSEKTIGRYGVFNWPSTAHGSTVSLPCEAMSPDSPIPRASRTCYIDHGGMLYWGTEIPDKCKKVTVTKNIANSEIQRLQDNDIGTKEEIEELFDVVYYLQMYSTNDLEVAHKLLRLIDDVMNLEEEAFVANDIGTKSRDFIDMFVSHVKLPPDSGGTLTISFHNIKMKIHDVRYVDVMNGLEYSPGGGTISIKVPGSAFAMARRRGSADAFRVSFIYYKTSKLFKSHLPVQGPASEVIAASINDTFVTGLEDCVEYILPYMTAKGGQSCVFWDDVDHMWSKEGVHLMTELDKGMKCCSRHLTNFAILLEVDARPVEMGHHEYILTVLSYAGSALSILGLFLTFLTYILFRSLNREKTGQILIQLCFSMLLMNILFIVASDKNHVVSDHVCLGVSVALHFFVLSTLLWMSVEAYNMYKMLVQVFGVHEGLFLVKRLLFAWGLPCIPVGVAVGTDYLLYNHEGNFCRLSGRNPIIYYATYIAPACLIIFCNLIIFIILTKVLIRPKLDRKTGQKNISLTQVRGIMAVLVLLGVSWILGIFAIGEAKVAISYAFVITNSLQGFCIFVFQCSLNPEARAAWSQLIKTGTFKKYRGKTPVTSTAASQSGTTNNTKVRDTDYCIVSEKCESPFKGNDILAKAMATEISPETPEQLRNQAFDPDESCETPKIDNRLGNGRASLKTFSNGVTTNGMTSTPIKPKKELTQNGTGHQKGPNENGHSPVKGKYDPKMFLDDVRFESTQL